MVVIWLIIDVDDDNEVKLSNIFSSIISIEFLEYENKDNKLFQNYHRIRAYRIRYYHNIY